MQYIARYSAVVLATTVLVSCGQAPVKPDMSSNASDYKGINRISTAEGRRIALVIGNADYTYARPLQSPVNDAKDVSKALRKDLQFDEVFDYHDASKTDMQAGVKRFVDQLGKNDVAFFYFSGHGLQLNGKNYLLPVEADLNTDETDKQKLEKDVENKAVSAEEIADGMAKAKTTVVVLDACRNQLLPPGNKSLTASNSLIKGDLAPLLRSVNDGEMSVIYATTHGKPAFDGKGRNSLFTKHLVRGLKKQLTVLQLVQFVNRTVRVESEREYGEMQVPWTYNSLTEDVCLSSECRDQTVTPERPNPDETVPSPVPERRRDIPPPPT